MKPSSPERPGLWDFLTVPPSLSLLLVVLLVFFGGEGPEAPGGAPALWIAFLVAYVFLAVGDLLSRLKGLSLSRSALQCLCQGIVLTALPSYLGTSAAWSWIGLALLATGLILSLSRSAPSFRPPVVEKKEGPPALPVTSFLETLPLPAFFDVGSGEETTFLANEAALALAATSGQTTTEFFGRILAEGRLSLGDRDYDLLRAQGMALALLVEKQLPLPVPQVEADRDPEPVPHKVEGRERGLLRAAEELARARRYRRWLSAVLIRPDQIGPLQLSLGEAQRQEIFDLFLGEVALTLRDSEPLFRLGPQELLALLPETPQAGARKFSSRLKQMALEFKPKVFGLEAASGPFLVLKTGIAFYDGNGVLTLEEFFSQLEASIIQNL